MLPRATYWRRALDGLFYWPLLYRPNGSLLDTHFPQGDDRLSYSSVIFSDSLYAALVAVLAWGRSYESIDKTEQAVHCRCLA
jgi:hypothetical protein